MVPGFTVWHSQKNNKGELIMRGTIKLIVLVLVMLIAFGAFAGCSPKGEVATDTAEAADVSATEEAAAPEETEKPAENVSVETKTIGVLFDFLQVERRVISKTYLEQFAAEAGVELIFLDANGDEATQMKQAENLITKEVDVLVVLPQNAEACKPMVDQAKEAGIPIISFDRLIPDADIDYYVGFDNDVIGDMMAQYVFDLKPTGNYVLIQGAPTDPNCKVYKDGWMRVIGDAVESGDITIVGDAASENWDPNNAFANVENFLTMNNDNVDVILAMNDGTGGGSIQALKGRNLNGKVLVTGQDGELAACQRIVEGDQIMTVWKPDNDMAKLVIDACIKIMNGETPDVNGEINNGLKDVPAILVKPVVVDKNNMKDTIIAAGYYPEEEVYKNVTE
jgi:D-xylose transport system substrate-binding protein